MPASWRRGSRECCWSSSLYLRPPREPPRLAEPRLLLDRALLALPELPPKALRLVDPVLRGTSRLPTVLELRLAPAPALVVRLPDVAVDCGRFAPLVDCGRFAPLVDCGRAVDCERAADCRDESESPRAVPPNLSAVALFA